MTRRNPNRSKPSYVRRLGLVEAVKSGFGIFIKGKIRPSVALGLPRLIVRVLAERACRERVNRENALKNQTARQETRKKSPQKWGFNALVNTMPGWQRHRWTSRGYKGLSQKNLKPLKKFIANNPTRKAAL